MVASAVFVTDLTGKPLISRNYRGDVPLASATEKFASYLLEVEDDDKKPVFHVDANGDFGGIEDVGCTGPGGETYVYVQVRERRGRGRRRDRSGNDVIATPRPGFGMRGSRAPVSIVWGSEGGQQCE